MSTDELWTAGHRHHNADRAARIASALKCLKLVRGLLPIDSVIDFGCGIGAWLHAAQTLGAQSVIGLEGKWIRGCDTVVDQDRIEVVDLASESPTFSKEFDLAMSIEVAEHLPETAADGFCSSMVSASDHILFSAAIPGQGGIGHCNEQPLPYWVTKFWQRGYVPIEPIRPYIATDRSIHPWLRQNLIMFVNYDTLIRADALLRFARPFSDFRLHYRIL
jgi:cyclopropane fatty-acyl-phospholipid synthase-like methyltransferase